MNNIKEEHAMLVLTRKINEAICIGDGIEIVVLEVNGSRVRLGFKAPHNVSIQRREVAERIAREFGIEEAVPEFAFAG